MRKSSVILLGGIFLATGILPLTGCDLFKGKHKDQGNAAPSMTTTSSVAEQPAVKTPGPLPPDVLVRVGSWTLTKQEFDQRLKLLKKGLPGFKENDANTQKTVLDELIRQQLLVQDAQDQGIGDSKDIKDAVDDFRKTLLVQELANRLTKNVSVSPTDARLWYDENKDKFVEPTTWSVSEIVVADEATAKNVLVQVLQGGDFAQIAQAQSKGDTAAKGGVLPSFVTGKAPFSAMQTAIANLDEGAVSTVFKGPEGYYLVKVDSKKGGSIKPFADIKDDLVNGLTLRKQQEVILEYLNKLAQKNKVEINKVLIDQIGQ